MQCPHCSQETEIIWVGFGNEWVACHCCQRRIFFDEIRAGILLMGEDSWDSPMTTTPTYN